MVLRVSGKNVELGDALRSRIDTTVADAVQKYFDGGYSGQVIVTKDGSAFATECSLHLDTGVVLEASGSDLDANVSFDTAAKSLEKQLRRYKRRLKDHRRPDLRA